MANSPFDPASTTVQAAQREMRHAYFGGAPGMMISGLVWAIAAVVCLELSPARAIWALFIGGMFIHPVSVVIVRMLGRPGSHTPGNPMGALAMATTIWMILSFALAYAASMVRIEWFFPAMLAVIGGRYLTFATIYGGRIYWACGAALAVSGWLLAQALVAPYVAAAAGAAIEAAFALPIFMAARRESAAGVLAPSA
jgi:hypothetical protein